ncbi:hypothetical protein [Rhodoferax antarcticus]|uniref:hypothetical protein n=1 Tax=Rhodoferax antarcticus TaxID=81479 RepID=UPI0022247DE7|nr:hypothetical protein [Rhodoferax antarcticus]MCW2314356.1 hypothetical protein [Rhodoferax antarcticus]
MSTSPRDDQEDQDVESWFKQLRSSQTDEPTAANEEDRVMYQAIIQNHRQKDAELLEGAQSHDHAWQQMRFRLKREGLLQSFGAWKTWMPMAMAAALVAAVALPMLLVPGIDVLDTEPTMMRGSGLNFKVSQPLPVAKDVAKELKALDPELELHWYGGVATIDTDLEASELDQAEAIIRSKIPQGQGIRLNIGFNRLEFSAVP